MDNRAYNLEKYRAEDSGPGILEENVEQWQAILDELNRILPKIRWMDSCAGSVMDDYIHDHIAPALEAAKDKLNDFHMGEVA